MNKHANHSRGFTLVEMAMALVIIGLVMGAGFAAVGMLFDRAAYSETRTRMDQFKQVVLGFATRTQRLPKYTGTAAVDDEISPNIPSITDFWDRKLIYLYDPELARSDVPSPICAKRTTNVTLRTCTDLACATYADTQNIAFVFFSSGKDLVNQTDAAATSVVRSEPSPYSSYSGPVGDFGSANLKIIKTFGQGYRLGQYSSPSTSPTPYDDQLVTITLDELRQRLGCSVKPLRLINIDLPMGAQGASYKVDILAEGGVPISSTENYRWCIESTDAGTDADAVFQIKDRNGNDYSPPRTIARQGTVGACMSSVETGPAWSYPDLSLL